jgi:hypothetical protein
VPRAADGIFECEKIEVWNRAASWACVLNVRNVLICGLRTAHTSRAGLFMRGMSTLGAFWLAQVE